jgi:hypothetical protein
MRSFRWLAVGCTILVPALASGQSVRGFENSWYWGVKGGLASFSTETESNSTAPSVGGEWLITRTRFGLYISGDVSFFDETSAVPGFAGPEPVAIENLRRATVAGLVFPKAFGSLRPYGGLGVSLNWIGKAEPMRVFAPDEQVEESYLRAEIEDRKDRASFLLMGGLQGQYGRLAPFAQVTWQPSQVGFLLSGRAVYLLEGGFRYNFGSAVEKQ